MISFMNKWDDDLIILNRYVERRMNDIVSIEYKHNLTGIKSEVYKVSFATSNKYIKIFRIYNYGNEFYCHMDINMAEIQSNDSSLYRYYASLYNLLKFTNLLLDMVI